MRARPRENEVVLRLITFLLCCASAKSASNSSLDDSLLLLRQVPSLHALRRILATGRKLELVEDTPSDLRVGPEDGG